MKRITRYEHCQIEIDKGNAFNTYKRKRENVLRGRWKDVKLVTG